METKIFDSLLEPTFLITGDKRIIYCNEPAALIADISVRKLLRSKPQIDEVFRFQESIQALLDLNSVQDQTSYQEVSFSTESGKTGKVQITAQPFPGPSSDPCWLVYFRDVTLEETLQKKYRAELEQKEDVILDLQKAQAELKNYSENLERMVAERTEQIAKMNQLMGALLDSLSQGFFMFNSDGLCFGVSSKACESTVECTPKGKYIWDVLKLSEKQIPGFKKWMTTVFAEMLPFEDLAPLGPQKYPHSENKVIQLDYSPLRNSEGKMDGVVVISTDITNLVHAQEEAERERTHAQMILKLVKNKKQVSGFIRESLTLLGELKKEMSQSQINHESTFRVLHTLKGGAATFSVASVAEKCHSAETLLTELKDAPSPEKSQMLKQLSEKIEQGFSEFLEENKEIIGNLKKNQERWVETPVSHLIQFQKTYLNQVAENIQHAFIENLLTEPIGSYFQSYNEVVQAVADQEGKQIHPIQLINDQLLILPEPYENLFGTCIHAFRNAADHGIERPEIREAAGKAPQGTITVTFDRITDSNQMPWLQINIKDDGGGISPEKIREKLKSKGIDCSKETDHQVIQHIFDSQFSTKEQVTETSGRGVGMDAILFAAKKLGGQAWVESTLGKGSQLFIKVPYLFNLNQNTAKPKAA